MRDFASSVNVGQFPPDSSKYAFIWASDLFGLSLRVEVGMLSLGNLVSSYTFSASTTSGYGWENLKIGKLCSLKKTHGSVPIPHGT